jgi:Ca-activated chloride channel family protein
METAYSDLNDSYRHDITVELTAHTRHDNRKTTIDRLTVTDQTDRQFIVYVTTDATPPHDWQPGTTYRITDVLASQPPSTPDQDQATRIARELRLPREELPADWTFDCPDCGGRLRRGEAVDTTPDAVATAVTEDDVDALFGIADEQTTIEPVETDGERVDDWQPMETDSRQVRPPEFTCRDCGRHVQKRELYEQVEAAFQDTPLGDEIREEIRQTRVEGDMALNESMQAPASAAPIEDTLGLAAGGSKDIGNFRENIDNGHTPQPEAITDEGLFYDYYFETGERDDPDALFAPRYATAVSDHPLTDQTEQYLSVGLDSTLSAADFERPRLDLVAVLDVSGSMSSPFDDYYYDEHGRKRSTDADNETKLEAATESLCALTEQLHDDDRLGVVLYDHRAHVAKPLREVGRTDMPAIRRHIREIQSGGSTNLADGFEAALDLLADGDSGPHTERRVVFMTDMMPNTGTTGETDLTDMFEDAAADGIHTTFLGMGIDANAELTEALSGIRGANHYFVHSADEFEQRLGEEFDYMVSPLVYDLGLELDAEGYEVEAVHGSPSSDPASGQLIDVGTLFPSPKEDGEARGGVILVRLTQTAAESELTLGASWVERDGSEQTEAISVEMPAEPHSFAHNGVRKAVALARYARELRAWARDIHDRADNATGVDDWLLNDQRGEHERESVPLVVPERYEQRLAELQAYLQTEKEAVGDDTLQQELDLLETLHSDAPQTTTEARE